MGCTLSRSNGCQPFATQSDSGPPLVESGVTIPSLQLLQTVDNNDDHPITPRAITPRTTTGDGCPLNIIYNTPPSTTYRNPSDIVRFKRTHEGHERTVHERYTGPSKADYDVYMGQSTEGAEGGSRDSFSSNDSVGELKEEPGSPGQSLEVGDALFVVDACGHRVRRYDLITGQEEVFAGSGLRGTVDGVGEKADFNYPYGLAVGTGGMSLFVLECGTGTPLSPDHQVQTRRIDLKTRSVETVETCQGTQAIDTIKKKSVLAEDFSPSSTLDVPNVIRPLAPQINV